jgi:ribosomal protein L35AE/L33A
MKASEARKLIGERIQFRKRYSGITETGTILRVQGRNVEVDIMGMRDWLWLPDVVITPVTTSNH